MDTSYAKTAGADTPNPAPSIRRAGPADAEALAAIGRATFVETFGHLYPPEDLAAFLGDAHGVERAKADLANPAKAVWLVEAGDQVVGYALACPAKLPHPDVTAACGELDRIYLLADYRGGGMGSRLIAEVFAWLERDGPRRIWLGVFSENVAAQRLYARHGFEVVGSYNFVVGKTLDHELIMRRG
jgi:ribosomal protein S18 acetylase RimI-like enzyme